MTEASTVEVPSDTLMAQLQTLALDLTQDERTCYKLMLSLAASELSPGFDGDRALDRHDAYSIVSNALVRLHAYGKPVTANGIAWKGRPDFLTDVVLKGLQREAKQLRPNASNYEDHFLAYGGPQADALAISEKLTSLVEEVAGQVIATGIASFIFYDKKGQGIPPHVDTDIFSLNVLLMLEHNYTESGRSDLVLFPPDQPRLSVPLSSGELVIFYAGGVMHGRQPLHEDEQVTILTFGFKPK